VIFEKWILKNQNSETGRRGGRRTRRRFVASTPGFLLHLMKIILKLDII
jgi:hypothetical protein